MKAVKALSFTLICLFILSSLGCHLGDVERQTSVEGIVHLATGSPVANYPLTLSSYKASLYGRGSNTTIQELGTDQQGQFTYSGSLKTGLGYSLSSATFFTINGKGYSLDTIEATSSDLSDQFESPVNISPGQQYQLKIVLSN